MYTAHVIIFIQINYTGHKLAEATYDLCNRFVSYSECTHHFGWQHGLIWLCMDPPWARTVMYADCFFGPDDIFQHDKATSLIAKNCPWMVRLVYWWLEKNSRARKYLSLDFYGLPPSRSSLRSHLKVYSLHGYATSYHLAMVNCRYHSVSHWTRPSTSLSISQHFILYSSCICWLIWMITDGHIEVNITIF